MMNDEIADLLEERWPPPELPKVSRNKNNKTISVKNVIGENRIPIKVIAPNARWLEFEEIFLINDFMSLEVIQKHISRPGKNLFLLREYYDASPKKFSNEFYDLYIWEANLINPKNELTRKPRGLLYPIERHEMVKLRYTAGHLYVFLKYWFSQPESDWPFLLAKYIKKHEISSRDKVIVTQQIIEKHFGIHGISKINQRKFYNRYIQFKKLKIIKKAYENISYTPSTEMPKIKLLMEVFNH